MCINMSKVCSKCKQTKSITEYGKDKTKNDGLNTWCKVCVCNYYQNNKSQHLDRSKRWKNENSDKWKSYMKQYHIENKIQNPHIYKWRDLLWGSIKRLGGNKESSTHNLLKYSPQELKEHLDKHGMNWETDHIDHKIPITWFIETTPPYIANDLRNLQPLNDIENKSKRNNYSHPIDKEYYNLVIKYIKEKYKNNLEFKK